MSLQPISIMSGTNALRGYDDKGIVYGGQPIQEYVLIDTGAMLQGNIKVIDFTMIEYEIAIDSIWVLADNANVADVDIFITDVNDLELHRLTVEQDNNRTCCSPPFLVLDKRYRLKITPHRNVHNILIYGHRVAKIQYFGITDQ